jgi:hypothetical protein
MPDPATPPLPPCSQCGYDLAGLAMPGMCPECGQHNDGTQPERLPLTPNARLLRTALVTLYCAVPVLLFVANGLSQCRPVATRAARRQAAEEIRLAAVGAAAAAIVLGIVWINFTPAPNRPRLMLWFISMGTLLLLLQCLLAPALGCS